MNYHETNIAPLGFAAIILLGIAMLILPRRHAILPMLIISCFKVFDLIMVMTGGGPGRATNVLVIHTYNTAFRQFEFGYSSTIAMVLFVLVLGITIVQFYMERRWVSYM